MPLYEYQCDECGLRFEKRQHFSDEPVKVCPECGGSVERLIQPAGIIFKGSGFYVTDHRSKSPTAVAGSRRDEKEAPSENASSKPDTPAKEKAGSPSKKDAAD